MQHTDIQSRYDVVILGGGLAGLTLSLQLKQRFADISILVLERRRHPVPLAAHKVGESTVEIGAHYFEHVLGFKSHLEKEQIKKFGFRFFFNDGAEDVTSVTELGASQVLPTPSYQIDRGIFENMLGELALSRGIHFVDGAVVRNFTLSDGEALHDVKFEREEGHAVADAPASSHTMHVKARWLVDACGRAGLIKRKLGLAEQNGHNANAVWFRIADRLDVNEWSQDTGWLERTTPRERWRSTNHLCGEGYWAWLIPLASGSHSVGIVADAELHPLDTMNTFDRAMEWCRVHQPQLHRMLDARRDKLQDFAFFKRFSYGCKQVFDGKSRWALTGEAGLFLDPFYSPGSDFIAIGNTYITELIAQDRANGPVSLYADIYQQIFFQLYENMLTLYEGQYKLFGDPQVMPVKVIWDYTYYWGVMCQLFFQNRLTDVVTMGRMQSRLAKVQKLNKAMQRFLRAWGESSERSNEPQMLDQASLPWFRELNRGLRDNLDNAGFEQRMNETLAQLDTLASEIVRDALLQCPTLDATEVLALARNEQAHPATAIENSSMLFAEAA